MCSTGRLAPAAATNQEKPISASEEMGCLNAMKRKPISCSMLTTMTLGHGHDERLPVSFIESGLPVLWDVIEEFCVG
jgi:hypothetical protein